MKRAAGVVLSFLLSSGSLVSAAQPVRVASTDGSADFPYPRLAGSPDGLLLVAWSNGVRNRVTTSRDQGRTWLQAQELSTEPSHAVAAASGGDRLDFVSTSVLGGSSHRRSTDGGVTWGAAHPLPFDAEFEGARTLATSPAGTIALALWNTQGDRIEVIRSTDAGLGWSLPIALDAAPPGGRVGKPELLWLDDQTLLACWGRAPLTPQQEFLCRTSTDAGVSFAPSVVARTAPRPGSWTVPVCALDRRGASALLVLHENDETFALESADAGATWSVPLRVAGRCSSQPPVLGGGTDGEAWLLACTGELLHTVDGMAWTTVAAPIDVAGSCAVAAAVFAVGPGRAVLAGRATWRTDDGGATWDEPAGTAPFREPVVEAQVVALAGGGIGGLWVEGNSLPRSLRASRSDDAGQRWSLPQPIASLAFSERGGRPLGIVDRAFDVTPLAAGGALAAWLARGPVGCAELRVSRTTDFLAWQTAPPVTTSAGRPVSVVEDGSGRVVVLWSGSGIESARSLDGGATFSPGQGIPLPWDSVVSQARRAADGAVVAITGQPTSASTLDVTAWRSDDGGLSWTMHPVGEAAVPDHILSPLGVLLTAAGPRLVASLFVEAWPWLLSDSSTELRYESLDGGQTWSELPRAREVTLPLAGGPDGSLYVHAIRLDGRRDPLLALRPDGSEEPLGELPFADAPRGAVVLGPDRPGVLYADWIASAPPGVFFVEGTIVPVLLRSSTQIGLDPRPDLSTIYPLPVHLTGIVPGMVDPIPGWPPLLLYQVENVGAGVLKLARTPSGEVVLSW